GPQEHHAKAGTPTMGGIIIFTAIAVPFLLLTNRDPRSLTVLGDMLELGAVESALHREVGTLAGEAGVELLVTVGPRAAAMLDTFDGEGYAVADAGEAAALTADLIAPGDVVLVKGSRGVGLEVVAPALAVAEAPRG
ncbi:MAG TPA: hypothetical protein VFP78_06245, partial [Solirubrobacteraceae bacterium]|nr:hypothetical protein [Solirubrobacteraceae bacterium]